MKARKSLTLLLAALTLTACDYDDSALWEQVNQNTEDINQNTEDIAAQAERIAALEAWQADTNTNLHSLQTLLSTTDYITAVKPAMENGAEVGYTITFLHRATRGIKETRAIRATREPPEPQEPPRR